MIFWTLSFLIHFIVSWIILPALVVVLIILAIRRARIKKEEDFEHRDN